MHVLFNLSETLFRMMLVAISWVFRPGSCSRRRNSKSSDGRWNGGKVWKRKAAGELGWESERVEWKTRGQT